MRKLLFVLGLVLALSGCRRLASEIGVPVETSNGLMPRVAMVAGLRNVYVRVVNLDECEYLIVENGNSVAIVHKENCPNPEHK